MSADTAWGWVTVFLILFTGMAFVGWRLRAEGREDLSPPPAAREGADDDRLWEHADKWMPASLDMIRLRTIIDLQRAGAIGKIDCRTIVPDLVEICSACGRPVTDATLIKSEHDGCDTDGRWKTTLTTERHLRWGRTR